jgi:hypothetical protein
MTEEITTVAEETTVAADETEYTVCLKYVLGGMCESMFHKIHGQSHKTTEYYVPEYNIAFNFEDDVHKGSIINVFKTDKPRASITEEILFPKRMIDKMLLVLEHMKKTQDTKNEILDDEFLTTIGFVKDNMKNRYAEVNKRLSKTAITESLTGIASTC